MGKRIFILQLLPISLLISAGVYAQSWGAKEARPIETPKDSLKKGEFTWAPQLAPSGPILVTVSLDEQMAYTYRNGVLIGVSTASTGKKGHETPTGVFHTSLKDVNHHSSKYNNAPMPYTQRFTSSGIALHAGGLPGYPSSHGCVHLPTAYARLLFNEAPMGMTVMVTNKIKYPETVDHPSFLSPVTTDGKIQDNKMLSKAENYRWNPGKSSDGPVSILISRADKRLVVIRNGIEIGRCKISILNETDSIGTYIYVAHQKKGQSIEPEDKNIHWLTCELSDSNYGSGRHGNQYAQLKRIKIPDAFLREIQEILLEGTTLMITDASILRKTTGKEMAVVSSNPES